MKWKIQECPQTHRKRRLTPPPPCPRRGSRGPEANPAEPCGQQQAGTPHGLSHIIGSGCLLKSMWVSLLQVVQQRCPGPVIPSRDLSCGPLLNTVHGRALVLVLPPRLPLSLFGFCKRVVGLLLCPTFTRLRPLDRFFVGCRSAPAIAQTAHAAPKPARPAIQWNRLVPHRLLMCPRVVKPSRRWCTGGRVGVHRGPAASL